MAVSPRLRRTKNLATVKGQFRRPGFDHLGRAGDVDRLISAFVPYSLVSSLYPLIDGYGSPLGLSGCSVVSDGFHPVNKLLQAAGQQDLFDELFLAMESEIVEQRFQLP
mgnify:CR=1 FL=1